MAQTYPPGSADVRSRPGSGRPALRTLGVALGAALVLAACSGPPSAAGRTATAASLADMEPVTLTFSSNVPQAGALGQAQEFFGQEVERLTDGRITVDNFYSGELLPGEETLAGVGSGTASIGFVTPFYSPTENPITYWMEGLGNEIPPFIPNSLVVGTAATQDLFATDDALNAEFEQQNVHVLSVANTGPYRLTCTRPVTTPEEAAGATVRSNSALWNGELEALGMVPVNIPLTEVYEGLQRGVVDCWATTETSMRDEGVMEVATDFVPVNLSSPVSAAIFVMNLDEWNALPPDAQEIVQQSMEEAMWRWVENHLAGRIDFLGLEQVTWHDPRPLNAVVEQHQQQRVRELVSTAPASLPDASGFVERYRGLLRDYDELLAESTGLQGYEFDPDSVRAAYEALPDFDLAAFRAAVAEHREQR